MMLCAFFSGMCLACGIWQVDEGELGWAMFSFANAAAGLLTIAVSR